MTSGDLATWLRAQIDEDEREIAKHPDGEEDWEPEGLAATGEQNYPCTPYLAIGKKRALAEVDAKRRIIEAVLRYEARIDGEWGCLHSAEQIGAGECEEARPAEIPALRLLALPYAGRDGYREEWRP